MTEREEQAVIVLNTLYNNPLLSDIHRQALEVGIMAIKAIEQEPVMPVMYYPQVEGITPTVVEPCTDAISREGVAQVLLKYAHSTEGKAFAEFLVSQINALPSVTPQRKVGQWEWVQYDSNPNIGNWHCSECRTIIPHMPEETDNTPIYKWCPMCGSRMMQEVEK